MKPVKILTPEESLKVVKNQNKKLFEEDIEINKEFYKEFNAWLEKIRNSA